MGFGGSSMHAVRNKTCLLIVGAVLFALAQPAVAADVTLRARVVPKARSCGWVMSLRLVVRIGS